MAAALVLGLLLLALRPADRARTRNALVILVLCAFAQLADGLIVTMAGARVAAIAADVASVLIGVVLIRLGTSLLFHDTALVLPVVAVRGPGRWWVGGHWTSSLPDRALRRER